MSEALRQLRDALAPLGVSDSHFAKSVESYFKSRFKEVGAVGIAVTKRDWRPTDDTSPFFVLCRRLARLIRNKYRYRPFVVELIGSGRGLDFGSYYGLVASLGPCTLRVSLLANTDSVKIAYDWPDYHVENDVDGSCGASSHRSRYVDYDLTNPNSIASIISTVMGFCRKMLTKEPG